MHMASYGLGGGAARSFIFEVQVYNTIKMSHLVIICLISKFTFYKEITTYNRIIVF